MDQCKRVHTHGDFTNSWFCSQDEVCLRQSVWFLYPDLPWGLVSLFGVGSLPSQPAKQKEPFSPAHPTVGLGVF